MAYPDMIVSLPQIAPPRFSLVQSAEVVNHPTDRFAGGVTWTPEPWNGEGGGTIGVTAVDDPGGNPVQFYARNAPATGQPFGIWASEKSSSFGLDWPELQARVQRKLAAYESGIIEGFLWDDPVNLNPDLKLASASATTVGSSAGHAVMDAFGYLDMAIAQTWGRGMIHCRPILLNIGISTQFIHQEGNVWMTSMGNIVVPGVGYSGTGPNGEAADFESEWAYATPPVQVHRGAVFTTPGELREATNKAENTVSVHAMRLALAAWDYTEGHFAVKVVHRDPGTV